MPKTCVHYYLCNNLYKAALHFDFCLHACTCAHAVLDVQWAPISIRLSYLHCTSWLCISHLCCRAKVKVFANKYKFSGPHPSHKQAMMLQNPHLLHHHRYILPASPRRIHHQGNTGTSWTINRILALRTLTWIIWVLLQWRDFRFDGYKKYIFKKKPIRVDHWTRYTQDIDGET